jgi:hypothetical protein
MAVHAIDSCSQRAHLAWLGGRVGFKLCYVSILRHRLATARLLLLARMLVPTGIVASAVKLSSFF